MNIIQEDKVGFIKKSGFDVLIRSFSDYILRDGFNPDVLKIIPRFTNVLIKGGLTSRFTFFVFKGLIAS